MSIKPFSVVFYNRNFQGIMQPRVDISVERYSWNQAGGPKAAYLTAPVVADKWELTKLLRCPVEIYGGDGHRNWYGYVNKVSIPVGSLMVGIGLDELFNSYIIDYSGGATAAATDAVSINEYGTKEDRGSDSNATQTEAEGERDLYLSDHKDARPEVELSGGRNEIRIECYGWFQTLDWRYYTDASTTSLENTAQIAATVTACGQFLRGTQVENLANLTSNPARDGKSTALVCVNKLLNAGTSNGRPLLARVDADRWLHIYERSVEPPLGAADYLLRDDGNLITRQGAYEPPEHCICAAWVQVQDAPDQLAGISAMRPFFIESAEYDAVRDLCTYRPAGAFDQVRLARYIKNNSHGGKGGGGSSIIDPFGGYALAQPFAWVDCVNTPPASYTFNSRDLTIGAYDFFKPNNSGEAPFTIQSAGWYLVGGFLSCYAASELETGISFTGDVTLPNQGHTKYMHATGGSPAYTAAYLAFHMDYFQAGWSPSVSFSVGGVNGTLSHAWAGLIKISI